MNVKKIVPAVKAELGRMKHPSFKELVKTTAFVALAAVIVAGFTAAEDAAVSAVVGIVMNLM